jgi:hypothetical protein
VGEGRERVGEEMEREFRAETELKITFILS